MKKLIGYIDMTPTWRSIVAVLAEVSINGTSHDGRTAATGELNKMAALADRWHAWSREGA